jgi:hypothetical protein
MADKHVDSIWNWSTEKLLAWEDSLSASLQHQQMALNGGQNACLILGLPFTWPPSAHLR